MKKLVLLAASVMMAVSVSAQTVVESKATDNIYIGINGGVATKTTQNSWLGNLNPNAGLRLGRYFTPVFGLAVESNAYFSNKPYKSVSKSQYPNPNKAGNFNGFDANTGTFVRGLNSSLLATVNLSNWFGGYAGQPRDFEVVALYGYGWAHSYTSKSKEEYQKDALTSKAALDFQWNLGKDKAWAVYVEPSITWALNGNGYEGIEYNINKSTVQLNAGVIYRFKNSNGTHNFVNAVLRDQAEIDGLNNQINKLRDDLNSKNNEMANALSAKDKKIRDLQDALDECMKKPKKTATQTNLQPTVLFRQGKSVVDKAQLANVELIANYMNAHPDSKITIKGYASPEGSKEINDKLSNDRANNVKDILVKKYKIAADRINAYGEGATDKLFKQVEFNRVSTFNDDAMAEE